MQPAWLVLQYLPELLESLKCWSGKFSFVPCLVSTLPCRKMRRNNAAFSHREFWKMFAFTLVCLGERLIQLSLYMRGYSFWSDTYCVWWQIALLQSCPASFPAYQILQLISTLLSPSPQSEVHAYVPDLRRWPSFLPETRPRRQAEKSDQRKVVRERLWCACRTGA